jgi:hypothetical protein
VSEIYLFIFPKHTLDLAGAGDGMYYQKGIRMGRFGVRRQVIFSSSFSAREYSVGGVFNTPSTVVDRRTVSPIPLASRMG